MGTCELEAPARCRGTDAPKRRGVHEHIWGAGQYGQPWDVDRFGSLPIVCKPTPRTCRVGAPLDEDFEL